MHFTLPLRPLRWAALLTISLSAPAWADGDEHRLARVPLLPAYQQECSACHLAYPPGLLPAASWRRVMRELPQHFGSDASLDAQTVAQLTQWLEANARPARRTQDGPAPNRITQSAWFVHEHDELPAGIWRRKAIGSPANCMACHPQADQGRFHEHDIRMPR